jgi:replication-associated recombination protein RarA
MVRKGGTMTQGRMYHLTTAKGYDFFEVSSAFQKAVRRGDQETALYFAVEFYNSGYDEYLWKRMKIITSEDVGLAEANLPSSIHGLHAMYQEQKKKKDEVHRSERLFLVHAVLLLCRARKSRLVDWTQIAIWHEHESKTLPIPDYAYDKHNQKGRSMGRGTDHFFEEGSHLENQADIPGEAAMKERARRSAEEKGRTGT